MLFITFSLVVIFKYKSPEQLIIMGFFIFNSMIIVDAVTEYLKRGIGEPRPCAFYLCDYAGFAKAVNSGNYTNYYSETTFGKVGDFSKCVDHDGFMSWPSGHASTSFASMLASSFLLHYTFEFQEPIFNCVSYFPLIISTYISVSRVQDNKHHSYDVFSGAVIGCVSTLFMWQLVKLMLKKLDKKEDKGSELKQTTTNNYYEF
jgi:diacylglycerol diphosphate phosphatase/phosphatidate phosphatase